jgi:hypothetical protein
VRGNDPDPDALLLQIVYSIRSEGLLMEQLALWSVLTSDYEHSRTMSPSLKVM